ncbi:hypothetical protein N7533_011024 [Penicillium manginii]|uniref:uncharacterized protein n=1 Tax=Penicillium manginii TaxID=203109 RepID=UPI00254718E0|nr:uncharacterized protein N7533_011024 [Penicillium manginii]KAJ5741615.1 hypothetical protein N7533_011024 [Penicillium manginii]
MKLRRSKRVGRPRLDGSGEAILSEERRSQVRRAQRTYRQKKQVVFRDATARAEQLDARLRLAVKEVTALSEVVGEAQLHISHPDLYERLKCLNEIVAGGDNPIHADSPDQSNPVGSESQVQGLNAQDHYFSQWILPPPLPSKNYTYAFREVRFARRLQRYSLEYAYRLFTEARTDPREIYRVFRLVPCVQDQTKTQPRFLQLLKGGCMDSLEIPSLPFYNIGGAGAHFPDLDKNGNAMYPPKCRTPRRVLGIFPQSNLTSTGADEALETHGLGGDWFDSRDVEGYLRRHGVDVDSGLFPMVYLSDIAKRSTNGQPYILDIEGFFARECSIIRDGSHAYGSRSPRWTHYTRSRPGVQKGGS